MLLFSDAYTSHIYQMSAMGYNPLFFQNALSPPGGRENMRSYILQLLISAKGIGKVFLTTALTILFLKFYWPNVPDPSIIKPTAFALFIWGLLTAISKDKGEIFLGISMVILGGVMLFL